MPEFPHETLPLEQLSLSQFTYLMQQASESRDDLDFINTALCGRATDDDGDYRISLNARQELEAPAYPLFTRDFDSAIGITKNFPFLAALNVFPVPSFKETLKRGNHVRADIGGKLVPLNHIPNCGLGKVELRHITRIFFPKLYMEGNQHPPLSQKHFAKLYDKCIRPAVLRVMPSQSSHWPISYEMAFQQAKDTRGQLHLGTVAVPAKDLVAFCAALRKRLDRIAEFKDAFFCHELRGLKGGTAHEEDEEGRNPEEAFDTFFDNIDRARIDEGNWMVDVGLEIHDPNRIVLWSKSAHSAVLEYLLPSLDSEQVDKLQNNKSAFKLDSVAQLDDFAGFRCEPGKRAREKDGVEYINVYTTDKCTTYQLHSGIWRRRSCRDLLPNALERLLLDLDNMSRSYKACSGQQDYRSQEGCARLEIRVPLQIAEHALRDVPRANLQEWTFAVPTKLWWHFKYFRLAALFRALDLLNASPPTHRVLPSSLTLGAILIYVLNALNYRPAEGQRETDLTHTCCWNIYPRPAGEDLTESDEEDERPVPVLLSYGLYFISGVYMQDGTTFRMGGANAVSQESIERLYDVQHERDLNVAFHVKTISERANPRTQNRLKEPRDVRRVVRREELIAQETPLADRGVTMKPLPREHGEDIRVLFHNQMDGDDNPPREPERIDDIVTRIWRQFPYDIFEKAPNHRSNTQGSHSILAADRRREMTIEVFRATDLRELFSRVVIKIVDSENWRKLEFGRYFPVKNFKSPPRLQNFPNMGYYRQWNELMSRLSSKDAQIVRELFWETFKTFQWLPLTDSDRLWNTKSVKPSATWKHLPHYDKMPVARIGLNGALVQNTRGVRLQKEPDIVEISDASDGSDIVVDISSD